METQFYPINKNRFVLMLVVFVLFAIGGLWLIYYLFDNPDSDGYVRMPRLVFALPILGVLGVILALANLLSTTKGLTINNDGIVYNVGLNKFGPIAWDEIKGVEKKRYLMNDFIIVYLTNAEGFINSRGFFSKRNYRENYRTHGSPIVLNASQVKVDKDVLLSELTKRLAVK